MERKISVRMRGRVFGAPSLLYNNCLAPYRAVSRIDEFTYEGDPEGLASAYAAWGQQDVEVWLPDRTRGTCDRRFLLEPDVEVTLNGNVLEGSIVRGYVHGDGLGAFDFDAFLEAAAQPEGGAFMFRNLHLHPAKAA
ncbi:MAG TPA: hypothetical protein VGE59_00145 [Patescibacteria group bacterium]